VPVVHDSLLRGFWLALEFRGIEPNLIFDVLISPPMPLLRSPGRVTEVSANAPSFPVSHPCPPARPFAFLSR